MKLMQFYRSLLKQKYPPTAAREFIESCEGMDTSTLNSLASYFNASGKVKDIQATHFPTMTLAGAELVKKAANRVGLEPPKEI